MIYSLVFFLFGFLISFFSTPWVIGLAERGFGLDEANETRKRHQGKIPRVGGLPIMLALTGGIINILTLKPEAAEAWYPILVGAMLMFGLGLWDDIQSLGAKKKLFGQILIAILVYSMGLKIDKVTYPGGAWEVPLNPWTSAILTVLWLIAVPNIINLIDGFDGLAGGLGLFMSVTLGIVGLLSQQLPVAYFSFILAGALLGFLTFNFPPARIFLGDGGAYLIGFSIASLSLTSSHKGAVATPLLVTIVALGIPILDTTFALMRRAFRGFPLFAADDEHIHHRLEDLGFSKRRIILGMYGVCVVLSLVALSIVWSGGRTIPIAFAAIFLLAVFALRYLDYVRNFADVGSQVERVLGRRREVQFALLQAQILDMEVERCTSADEFWEVFHQTLSRVGFVDAKAAQSIKCIPIEVKYNGDGAERWTLLAPLDRGTGVEWQRIAECFRPVYVKARNKWPQ